MGTRSAHAGLRCPRCGRGNSRWADNCAFCDTPLRPPVKKPETPPATGGKIKGPWADVKVGTTVKMKVTGNMNMLKLGSE